MGLEVIPAEFCLEAHNSSIDEDFLRQGACALVHLPTGRTCTLRHGHRGSCEFVAPDAAKQSLARHQAAEGWGPRERLGVSCC